MGGYKIYKYWKENITMNIQLISVDLIECEVITMIVEIAKTFIQIITFINN